MPRNILLLTHCAQHATLFARFLDKSDYRIDTQAPVDCQLAAVAESCKPELVIIDIEVPDDRLFAEIRKTSLATTVPIVIFTGHNNRTTIAKALRAGVNDYIVNGLDTRRIVSILDVAVARFLELKRLHAELQLTRHTLAERKVVDRAKGILMKQKGFDEPQAYHALRKMAMDRNLRIGQAAENVIAVAEMLSS